MNILAFQRLAQVVSGLERTATGLPAFKYAADEKKDDKKKAPPRRKTKSMLEQAYPDYGKSLVSQRKQNPTTAGLGRAATTGTAGAILAALIARLYSRDPKAIGLAAGGGALLGGVPGFLSGKHEAESNYTKALALRRLGINNPAEMLVFDRSQILTPRVVEKGVRL